MEDHKKYTIKKAKGDFRVPIPSSATRLEVRLITGKGKHILEHGLFSMEGKHVGYFYYIIDPKDYQSIIKDYNSRFNLIKGESPPAT